MSCHESHTRGPGVEDHLAQVGEWRHLVAETGNVFYEIEPVFPEKVQEWLRHDGAAKNDHGWREQTWRPIAEAYLRQIGLCPHPLGCGLHGASPDRYCEECENTNAAVQLGRCWRCGREREQAKARGEKVSA